MYFKDRVEAGKKLAALLERFKDTGAVVYALPRGGVVTGSEVAKKIHAPLDLIITRKIGHPIQPEYAIGAIAENGHSIFNPQAKEINKDYLAFEVKKQKEEAKRRRKVYLGHKKPILCKGKVAILVDDGIATGLTMRAAIKELQMHYHPSKIVVAVPVIPKEIVQELEEIGVKLIAVNADEAFLGSIGAYYQDFSPVEDKEMIKIMQKYQ